MYQKKPTILIVDDNSNNLNMLFDFFEGKDFEIMSAKNGTAALEIIKAQKMDIILLDVVMPEVNGFEVCQKLKMDESTRNIPVIFMTALAETEDKVKGLDLGAVDYITKPLQPEEVLARVNTHLKIRQLQNELQESLDREKELNILKTRLISIAAHEIRNPLAAINMSCQLLQMYNEQLEPAKKERHFQRINQGIKRCTKILDEVLMMAKNELNQIKIHREAINLKEKISEILEDFKIISMGSHTIEFNYNCPETIYLIDKNLLTHVISNLLSNALKYSPENTTIQLITLQVDKDVILKVNDQGRGISEKDQEHLFEAFYRANNSSDRSGMGLGLSIVKQFVEQWGGKITVYSKLNEGSSFTVTIPQ